MVDLEIVKDINTRLNIQGDNMEKHFSAILENNKI